MPTTRSSARATSDVHAHALVRFNSTLEEQIQTSRTRTRVTKRKSDGTPVASPSAPHTPVKKARGESPSPTKSILKASPAPPPSRAQQNGKQEFVPAVLCFDFEHAKEHLTEVDARFGDIFAKMKCRPFENLERVDPFRTLVQSILGQQISWLAARSITYRFIRLYDQSLPETRPEPNDPQADKALNSFPTAEQVATTDVPTLKSAGLSTRKAEYVIDLASRFSDGHLSTEKLIQATDEELAEMLIAVRGIGRWTVDMFAMFSLRRPDILPVGDLGVQRGMLRWFLSLHSPAHGYTIEPKKLPKASTDEQEDGKVEKKSPTKKKTAGKGKSKAPSDETTKEPATPATQSDDVLRTDTIIEGSEAVVTAVPEAAVPDVSSVPPAPAPTTPAPVRIASGVDAPSTTEPVSDPDPAAQLRLPALPTPFTPSINKTLAGEPEVDGDVPMAPADPANDGDESKAKKSKKVPLPDGLSVEVLKSRLDGKKKIKGAFLTPQEMEALSDCWRPYRSLGVYYMWALAEGDES